MLTSIPIPIHPEFERPDTPTVSGKYVFILYFTVFAMFIFGAGPHWLGFGMALGLIGFFTTPLQYVVNWVN